ncbi:hypothetical protein K8R33_01055 [archaeon]|nr:hypothetical protein [archaeon]
MNKKKDIKMTKKNWPVFILTILVFLWLFGFFDGNRDEDYTDCVDWCVVDMYECMAMYMNYSVNINGEYWTKESYPDECYWDLDGCIDDCKLD